MNSYHPISNLLQRRHDKVVETMAQGMLEFQEREVIEKAKRYAPSVQYFLDRFYMNRVSIRMLITQHLGEFSLFV